MARSGGSLPASVYWRRRAVVFGGLLVIIAVVVLIVVRPGFGGRPPLEEPVAEETLEGIAAPNCLPSQLELTAMTDQSTYAPGQAPQLWLTVKNTSAVECTVNVGTDVQRYVITSGDDQIWASDDCQKTSLPPNRCLPPAKNKAPWHWHGIERDPLPIRATTRRDPRCPEAVPATTSGFTLVISSQHRPSSSCSTSSPVVVLERAYLKTHSAGLG